MYARRFLFTILCSLCFTGLMDAQFTWQTQTSPVTDDLVTVTFPSATSGWAATDNGKIIHTANGGKNWDLQTTLHDFYPEKIVFLDTLSGWMVGNNGNSTQTDSALILKTENGGIDWGLQYTMANSKLYDLFFLNDTMGWAVGYYLNEGDTVGLRLHTIDGGNGWGVQNKGINVATIYTSINFRDTVIGNLCGPGPILMHTNTGGRRDPGWAMDIKQISQPVYDLVNAGDIYGCMVGAEGKIIFTKDRWTNFFLDYDYEGGDTLWSIDAIDLPAFWIVGEAGTIIYAGISFIGPVIQDQSLDIQENLYEVDVLDDSHVWAVGQSGTILFYGLEGQPGGITFPTEKGFSLFPNPAFDMVLLSRSSGESDVIRIFNLQGIQVKSQKVPKGQQIIGVPLDDLKSGQYIIQSGVYRKKLLIIR